MLIQPKPYIDKIKLRNRAYGTERRRNMSKLILERGTPIPKPIEYSDIDDAMYRWVDERIQIAYDGKRLPTYKLYSTQRVSEYLQEWNNMDENGNPIINFKTVTRELNPQKGENQGNYFNIPGHKDFTMFYVPVLQENGTEAFDKYTMKQPFQVNFLYNISIISNKMEIINEMNELMHYEFSSITCYISPNDHPMSMTLEDVSDDSEYSIDDRKYYSQTYKVKVRGYIIRKEDFSVERIPSRYAMSTRDSDASGIVIKRGKNREKEDVVEFMRNYEGSELQEKMRVSTLVDAEDNCVIAPTFPKDRPSDVEEEMSGNTDCCDSGKGDFANKVMKIKIMFNDCTSELSFVIDKEMVLETIETVNVMSVTILVNGEEMPLEGDVRFYCGDELTVKITRDDMYCNSEVFLIGYDPNVVLDRRINAESSLDEPYGEEHILINYDE